MHHAAPRTPTPESQIAIRDSAGLDAETRRPVSSDMGQVPPPKILPLLLLLLGCPANVSPFDNSFTTNYADDSGEHHVHGATAAHAGGSSTSSTCEFPDAEPWPHNATGPFPALDRPITCAPGSVDARTFYGRYSLPGVAAADAGSASGSGSNIGGKMYIDARATLYDNALQETFVSATKPVTAALLSPGAFGACTARVFRLTAAPAWFRARAHL